MGEKSYSGRRRFKINFSEIPLKIKDYGIRKTLDRLTYQTKCRIISKLKKREWVDLPSQKDLLSKILQDEFSLIVLDACRYDFFEKLYPSFLEGELKKVKSAASTTPLWLQTVFEENTENLKGARIYSANPHLHSISKDFTAFTARKYVEGDIFDLWNDKWDSELGTVPPSEVLDSIKENGLTKKNIVWFVQPHIPYVGKTPLLSGKSKQSKQWNVHADQILKDLIKRDKISLKLLRKAYRDNLILVLRTVKELVEEVKLPGDVVVTSDHGELLGEYGGIFMHPTYSSLPEQRVVPWFIVDS